jgi:crotonobetainyl-CoA:carnitine CoA-transferase CaiB-like acyl-CoA transferase
MTSHTARCQGRRARRRPHPVGTSISDILGGIFGYCGVVTALAARERTGKGTTIVTAGDKGPEGHSRS